MTYNKYLISNVRRDLEERKLNRKLNSFFSFIVALGLVYFLFH